MHSPKLFHESPEHPINKIRSVSISFLCKTFLTRSNLCCSSHDFSIWSSSPCRGKSVDRLYHQVGNPGENLKQEKLNSFSPQRTCTHVALKNLVFLLKMGILQRNPYVICEHANVTKISVTLQECRNMGYAALLTQQSSTTHDLWWKHENCQKIMSFWPSVTLILQKSLAWW